MGFQLRRAQGSTVRDLVAIPTDLLQQTSEPSVATGLRMLFGTGLLKVANASQQSEPAAMNLAGSSR
jgi:hypothetical protein